MSNQSFSKDTTGQERKKIANKIVNLENTETATVPPHLVHYWSNLKSEL